VPAAFLNTELSYAQSRTVLERAERGEFKLLYIAPERLDSQACLDFASRKAISMVAVDEAHCLSHWGQDFRPSYLKICEFISGLKNRPVVSAFTATATPDVKDDIARILDLRDPF
jgi:ATP-dependent DNA helicase RecQ